MQRSNGCVLSQSYVGSEPDQSHTEMMHLGSNLSRTKANDGHIPHNNGNNNYLSLLFCHRNRKGSCMIKTRKKSLLLVFEWLYSIYEYKLKIGHGYITTIFKVSFERLRRRKLPRKKSHEQRS